jgi:hypothetical protein
MDCRVKPGNDDGKIERLFANRYFGPLRWWPGPKKPGHCRWSTEFHREVADPAIFCHVRPVLKTQARRGAAAKGVLTVPYNTAAVVTASWGAAT